VAIDTFLIAADRNGQLLTSESQINPTGIVDPLPNRPDISRAIFEIEDFSTDIAQTVTIGASSGTGTGKVNFSPLHITRKVDKQSPTLFLDICQGVPLKYVDILQRRASADGSGQVFFVLGFGTVLLSDLSWSHDEDTPMETVTLQYGEMWLAYRQQNPDGSLGPWIIKGWNRITNMPES
jgi:type VI secretion system secreted protein Hcp